MATVLFSFLVGLVVGTQMSLWMRRMDRIVNWDFFHRQDKTLAPLPPSSTARRVEEPSLGWVGTVPSRRV